MSQLAITFDDIKAAAGRLAGVAHRTPVLTSRTVDRLTGYQVYFKCENFQRGGAFKFRGAYNALAQLKNLLFLPEKRFYNLMLLSPTNTHYESSMMIMEMGNGTPETL